MELNKLKDQELLEQIQLFEDRIETLNDYLSEDVNDSILFSLQIQLRNYESILDLLKKEQRNRNFSLNQASTTIESFNSETIEIAGLKWATTNFGAPNKNEFGKYLTFSQAVNLCPKGWRLPTIDDFSRLCAVPTRWIECNGNYGLIFGEKLFLFAAGYLKSSTNAIRLVNETGFYWSSTSSPNNYARHLGFGNTGAYASPNSNQLDGFQVRYIKL